LSLASPGFIQSVHGPVNLLLSAGGRLTRCCVPKGQMAGAPAPGARKLSEQDLRPPVWVGHVVLETHRLEETAQFMRNIGLRPIVQRPDVAVLELRGGTHLVLGG